MAENPTRCVCERTPDFQCRFLLAMLDGGDAAFDRGTLSRYSSSFSYRLWGPAPQVAGAAEDQVEHLPVERAGLRVWPGWLGLPRDGFTRRGIDLRGRAWVGELKLQCE